MAAAHDFEALLSQMGAKLRFAGDDERPRPLALGWSELDGLLPDGGLPRGIVELSAPGKLGGATSVALAAVRAAQAKSPRAWCAWIDPEGSLHAPGIVAAGVELSRMLVVRTPRFLLGKVGVKVVGSGAFEVVVVDVDALGESLVGSAERPVPRSSRVAAAPFGRPAGPTRGWAPELLVRKLALAAEPSGATVLLLTDASKPRAIPWPVALRLELSRPSAESLSVRIAKERRGRVGLARSVPFLPVTRQAAG
jgi:recombination protein RecA